VHRQRRVRGDRVGQLERRREQCVARHHPVQEPDLERARRSDGPRAEQELVRVHPAYLPRQEHRRVPRRVEPERDLFEREGRLGHRDAQLARQHEIEAARARMAVDRRHERDLQVEPGEQRRRHVAQPGEVGGIDPLAARQRLRHGDGRAHVHAAAEHALSCPRHHRAAQLGVRRDLAPSARELVQHARVERVRTVRPVDRHQRDVGVGARTLELDRHESL